MSYISVIVALFQSQGSELTGVAWWNLFLDNLVIVETWFYHFSWWIWGVLVILGPIGVFWAAKEFGTEALLSLGCYVGCLGIIVLFYPLLEWVTMKLAIGMAESVTAAGVVNQGQLILNAVIYFLIGSG